MCFPVTLSSSHSTGTNTSTASAAAGLALVVDEEKFVAAFEAANRASWIAVTEDPVLSAGLSSASAQMSAVAAALLPNCEALCSYEHILGAFHAIFVGKQSCSEAEQDVLMRSVHQLRGCQYIQRDFTQFVKKFVPDTDEVMCRQLLQVWLRKTIVEILRILGELCKFNGTPCTPQFLSDTDQEVLYHVCGYIVRKLTSSAPVYRKLKNLSVFISCLSAKQLTECGHFVDKYKQWVHKQTRGGLSFPHPEVYLLVRELDSIFRQQLLLGGTNVGFVDKNLMRTEMMHSVMVKHYWGKILKNAHADAATVQPVLEHIVGLFITIKGFSLAKNEVNCQKVGVKSHSHCVES